MNQLSLFDGVAARDEALTKVQKNSGDFMARGISFIAMMQPCECTGEDLRLRLTKAGIFPHHPNAWGSLIMNAVRLGLLKNTGRVVKMKVKSSHARKTSVYVKDLFSSEVLAQALP